VVVSNMSIFNIAPSADGRIFALFFVEMMHFDKFIWIF